MSEVNKSSRCGSLFLLFWNIFCEPRDLCYDIGMRFGCGLLSYCILNSSRFVCCWWSLDLILIWGVLDWFRRPRTAAAETPATGGTALAGRPKKWSGVLLHEDE